MAFTVCVFLDRGVWLVCGRRECDAVDSFGKREGASLAEVVLGRRIGLAPIQVLHLGIKELASHDRHATHPVKHTYVPLNRIMDESLRLSAFCHC